MSSAPNWFASALIKREPSRLLVVGSNPAGKPAPSSRTDIKIDFVFARTSLTQIDPLGALGYAYLPAFNTSSLIIRATRMARSAANSISSGASSSTLYGATAASKSLMTSRRLAYNADYEKIGLVAHFNGRPRL